MVAVACSSGDADSGEPDTRPPTPAEWDRDVVRPSDADAVQGRQACKFTRGAMPAETLGASDPVDSDIPIKTIVVLMQENRSFDSYFSKLGEYTGRTDIEVAPADASNPDEQGNPVAFHHAEHMCFLDTNHEWHGSHVQVNSGKMDGFVTTNQGHSELRPGMSSEFHDGGRAMSYYDQRDLPYYYELAKTFAIADHYHCSLLGPTWPNRMYLLAATSFGRTENAFPEIGEYTFPEKDASILDRLEKRHVDWNVYTDGPPTPAAVHALAYLNRWERDPIKRTTQFFEEAAEGKLPPVVFLDLVQSLSDFTGEDEHPPGDVQIGERYVAEVVKALMRSPQWKEMALFITYDEHGGIYDHVVPPTACPPDDIAPIFEEGASGSERFDQLGIRVPLIVVSPYAKRGHVSHRVYDHTSITRFIEAKFKLPALSNRDANADPLYDLFDFQNPPFVEPPVLPEATINDAEASYCMQTFHDRDPKPWTPRVVN